MDLFSELSRCRKYIEDALEYGGDTHTFDDVAAGVLSGRYQLFPNANSAIVTEIVVYPQLKNLHFFLAGGNLDELQKMTPVIEDWGRSMGCTKVSLSGRKGWSRTFLKDSGYTPKWYVLSKEL
jgi:hypothetical protein